ncbi:MAG: PAS sensor histidine kinase [uncultured archaeon A07HN63]|nr:MAG: PAS sensor histidine kinase [uncultured archaeon A07HN63]
MTSSQTESAQSTEPSRDIYGWEIDLTTDTVTLGPDAQELLNSNEEPTLSLEKALELFDSDARPKAEAALNHAVQTNETANGTWDAELPDGDRRVFNVTIKPIPPDKSAQTLHVTLTDITAGHERRNRCQQLEAMCANAQDALFVIAPGDKFTIERVNSTWEKTTGVSAEQAIGQTPREVVDTAQDEKLERWCRACVARGQSVEYQHELRVENDSKQVKTTITPVTTGDEVEYLAGSIQCMSADEQQQKELRELQQAIDNANVAITLSDPAQEDNPLIYANDAFETLTGYSVSEALGENCRYLQGRNTDQAKIAALREAIDNEESITVELRNYRKDGSEFWNRVTVTPIYDDGGSLIRYLGTQQDVTDRKEDKKELQAERAFTQQALDTLDDLFYVVDTDGCIQRWNKRVTAVTGYTPAEVDGMKLTELCSSSDRQPISEAIETTLRDNSTTVTAKLRTKDGEMIPFEWSNTRLTDTDGETIGIVGIGRDISQRRERERRFQALVEESNDSISIVDADGRFQYQSPSIESILGYDPTELVGDSVWKYIHPNDHETAQCWFASVVNSGDTAETVELRVRHADGSWQWMEASGNDQITNSAVDGYVINSRKITARKQREQHLCILDRVLRHNFRNGMNVIRGRAEAIQSTAPTTAAAYANEIINKSDELIELTEKQRRLTSLIRDDSAVKTFDLRELLQCSVSTVIAEHPDAEVTIECPAEIQIQTTTDIEKAIIELVTNAVVHNDADAPTVTVSATQSAELIQISVADDGPPIPEAERCVLAERLQQTPLFHGSGLGLWLVKLIISKVGGNIHLSRSDSGGNIVQIELPQ